MPLGRRKKLKDIRRRINPPDVVPSLAWCVPCAKKAFTRDGARKLTRTIANRKGMREYECPVYGQTLGWWHTGHLPWTVRRGQMTAGEVYGRKETEHGRDEQAA